MKRLEELGVGRPSTYASIMNTIVNRGYVWKKGTALVPSFSAFAVVTLLEQHFPDVVDYAFTARMEDDLDGIANGDEEAVPWLSRFYFGNGEVGLHAIVSDRLDEIDAREVNSIPIGRDSEDREIVVRVGKFGPYLQRGELVQVLPDWRPPSVSAWAVFPGRRLMPARTRVFLDALAAKFAGPECQALEADMKKTKAKLQLARDAPKKT